MLLSLLLFQGPLFKNFSYKEIAFIWINFTHYILYRAVRIRSNFGISQQLLEIQLNNSNVQQSIHFWYLITASPAFLLCKTYRILTFSFSKLYVLINNRSVDLNQEIWVGTLFVHVYWPGKWCTKDLNQEI